jgi:branched-chain amino acid transport system substrate-binding protein
MVLAIFSGTTFAAGPAPATIKIGVMISLTGPDFQTGGPAKLGYELAVDEINKAGGVMVKAYGKKIPLELVMLDMETNPEKAIARAEAFNAQKVPVCVGTTLVGASAEIFEKNKLPVVASIMTINAVMDRGFKYFFNIGTLNSDIAQAIFDTFGALPKGTMPTKWAFLKEQSDFSTELFVFAKQIAAKRGISVVYEGQYAMMTPDLSALVTGAKTAGADVLFAYPTPPDAITMLKQMAQLGYKPKAVIMLRASDDPSWGRLGPLGDYAIGSPDWHPALNYPGVKELNAVVKAPFGRTCLCFHQGCGLRHRAGRQSGQGSHQGCSRGYRRGERRGSHKVQPQEYTGGRDSPGRAVAARGNGACMAGQTEEQAFCLSDSLQVGRWTQKAVKREKGKGKREKWKVESGKG